MTSRPKRLAIAALVPFLALWAAAWFDGNVVTEAMTQAGRNYDIAPSSLAFSASYLIAVGGGLAVATVSWWIRDQLVGLVYFVVGGFILFDGFLVARLAMSVNGAPPAAPEPIASFLTQVMLSTMGQSNAALVVAAAMVFAGLASFALAGQEEEDLEETDPAAP
ncbi:MAG: hypothetical protein ACXWNR_00845 [Candidatus Limnocylindrales bacterium]